MSAREIELVGAGVRWLIAWSAVQQHVGWGYFSRASMSSIGGGTRSLPDSALQKPYEERNTTPAQLFREVKILIEMYKLCVSEHH